jgi:hypothetical protein
VTVLNSLLYSTRCHVAASLLQFSLKSSKILIVPRPREHGWFHGRTEALLPGLHVDRADPATLPVTSFDVDISGGIERVKHLVALPGNVLYDPPAVLPSNACIEVAIE